MNDFIFSDIHPWQGDTAVMQILVFNTEAIKQEFDARFEQALALHGIEDASDSNLGAVLKLRAVRNIKARYIPIIRSGVSGELLFEGEPTKTQEQAFETCKKNFERFVKQVEKEKNYKSITKPKVATLFNPVFSYSELVHCDNIIPCVLPNGVKIKEKTLREVLDKYVLLYGSDEDISERFDCLLDNIYKLSSGTRFSVRSLAKCSNRSVGIRLGKLLMDQASVSDKFSFVTMYPGKSIYIRKPVSIDLVYDFDINLEAALKK